MTPLMKRSKVAAGGAGIQGEVLASHLSTTRYDLITAIQDMVGPEDDALVVVTMVHLLQSGQLTEIRAIQRTVSRSARSQHDQPREALYPQGT